MLKNARPAVSTVTISVFSGRSLSVCDFGISTVTGSVALNCVVSMKKVTRRKARSTIGVMSNAGLLLGTLILGILMCI
jgi:hypothetical protein